MGCKIKELLKLDTSIRNKDLRKCQKCFEHTCLTKIPLHKKENYKANEHPKSLGAPLLIKHLDLLIKKS